MSPLLEAYGAGLLLCLVAGYLGALIFGAAAVPALVLRLLPAANAAALLRAFWVRYHRLGAGVGGLITALCGAGALISTLPPSFSVILTGAAALMTLCFAAGLRLIPAINRARDTGDTRRFSRLHRFDVLLVLLALLLNAGVLGGLVYVLPTLFSPV